MSSLNIIVAIFVFIAGCSRIYNENTAIETATELSEDTLYDSAAYYYTLGIDSFSITDPNFELNYATNQYLKGDTSDLLYSKVIDLLRDQTTSLAFLQTGNLAINKIIPDSTPIQSLTQMQLDKKELQEIQSNYKAALLADFTNEDARYNFELIDHILKALEQNENKQDQQNKDQNKDQDKKDDQQKKDKNKNEKGDDKDKKDQQDKGDQNDKKDDKNSDQNDNKDGEKKNQEDKNENGKGDKKDQDKKDQKDKGQKDGDKKGDAEKDKDQQGNKGEEQKSAEQEQKEIVQQRMKEQNMSEEQAKKLLQSINQQEKKYIQQLQKKSDTPPPSNDKPDW